MECHRFAADTFAHVFEIITYKYILGLTATIERLDGKEELIKKHCPVCDEITLAECMLNGWISQYKEYQVLIKVDDIEDFKALNKEFQEHFSFFNFEFDTAMNCVGKDGFKNRAKLRDEMCKGKYTTEEERKEVFRNITYHATAMMRVLQARKAFINNHPKKLELTRKIIEARPNSKIITFSNNIKMAESIGIGKVYSGKDTKKKGRATLEELRKGDFKVLNTIQKANEG